jgi:hypothetical protein
VAVRRLVLEFLDLMMPSVQLPLFTWENGKSSKERNLQKVLDAIRVKFGRGIIAWGVQCQSSAVSPASRWIFRRPATDPDN